MMIFFLKSKINNIEDIYIQSKNGIKHILVISIYIYIYRYIDHHKKVDGNK